MEGLLNKLIEKGWKPRGHKPLTDEIKKKIKVERYNRKPMSIVIKNGRKYADDYYSLRELVSKESGLWQFVCENGMVENVINTEYTYRLIESALKDESELEDFLLSNIVIKDEKGIGILYD